MGSLALEQHKAVNCCVLVVHDIWKSEIENFRNCTLKRKGTDWWSTGVFSCVLMMLAIGIFSDKNTLTVFKIGTDIQDTWKINPANSGGLMPFHNVCSQEPRLKNIPDWLWSVGPQAATHKNRTQLCEENMKIIFHSVHMNDLFACWLPN